MKKSYSTPWARMVDFSYDEQVVATSVGGCKPEKVYSQSDSITCNLREGMSARMSLIGCDLYLDQVV